MEIIDKVKQDIKILQKRIDEFTTSNNQLLIRTMKINKTINDFNTLYYNLKNDSKLRAINWSEFKSLLNKNDDELSFDEDCVLISGPFIKSQQMILDGSTKRIIINSNVILGKDELCNLAYMFCECSELETVNVSKMIFENRNYNLESMFEDCLSIKNIIIGDFSTCYIETVKNMFKNCKELEKINLEKHFCSNIDCYYESLFEGCNKLVNVGDVLNVVDVSRLSSSKSQKCMFKNCNSIKRVSLPNKWIINNCDLSSMFENCLQLEVVANIDLLTFKFYNNFNLENMFKNCEKIDYVDLSEWANAEKKKCIVDCLSTCMNCYKLTTFKMFSWASLRLLTSMFENCEKLSNVYMMDNMLNEGFGCQNMFNNVKTNGLNIIMPALTMWKIISSNVSGLFDTKGIMKDKESINNYKFTFEYNSDNNTQILKSVESYR